MRPVLTIPLALAAAAALWTAGLASAHPAGCTTGMTTYKGVAARAFCGSATASVTVGGRKVSFQNGLCATTSQYVTINIGTVVLGHAATKPNYFGLNVGKIFGSAQAAGHDGDYKGGALAVNFAGKGYAINAGTIKVTLSGNRTKGTFTGKLLTGGAVSGSFSC